MSALHYFSLGTILMMLGYILSQYYFIRKPEYKYFSAYLICIALSFIGQTVFKGMNTFSGDLLYGISFSTMPILSFMAYFAFAFYFVDLKNFLPGFGRIVKIILRVLLVYLVVDFLLFAVFKKMHLRLMLYDGSRFVLILLSVIGIALTLRKGQGHVIYFAIGTLLFVVFGGITTAMQIYSRQGMFDSNFIFTSPVLYYRTGIMLQIFFFSLGMSYKVRQTELHESRLQLQLSKERFERALDKQKAIETTRSSIAGDLHDDVGATLSSIHIYSKLAREKIGGDADRVKSLLDKISSTSQEMMNTMSDIVWAIKPDNDVEESLQLKIKSFANEILSPGEIEYKVLTKGAGDPRISMEARKNIFLIAKEAINNIAKYSEARHVTIRLENSGGRYVVELRDDGKGFTTTNGTTGNGLANMKQRTEQLEGNFIVEAGAGSGTRIRCVFELDKIAY